MKTKITTGAWLMSLLCAMFCLSFGTPANAANVHLKGDPTFEDLGNNLEVCLSLAGLGNKDVTIEIEVSGTASVTYYNKGGNKPAGQNKFPVSAFGTTTIPSTQIKNGTVSVCLTTLDIEVGAAPNRNWTVKLDDVEFTSATISVYQGGKLVLQKTIQA